MGKYKTYKYAYVCVCAGKLFVCVCVCAHMSVDDSKVDNSSKPSPQMSLTIWDEIRQYEILLILMGKLDLCSIWSNILWDRIKPQGWNIKQ